MFLQKWRTGSIKDELLGGGNNCWPFLFYGFGVALELGSGNEGLSQNFSRSHGGICFNLFRDAGQNVSKIRFGIETVEFGAANQAVDRGSALAAGIGAGEQVVFAVQGEGGP